MERDLEVIFGIGPRGMAAHEERRQSDNPWNHGGANVIPSQSSSEIARYYQVQWSPRNARSARSVAMALAIGTILLPIIGPRRQAIAPLPKNLESTPTEVIDQN